MVLCALSACGQLAPGGDEASTIRLPLAEASAATPALAATSLRADPPQWAYSPSARGAWFGARGAQALLSVTCEGANSPEAKLRIVRFALAERGAEAVLAIQSSDGILRVPVSAAKMGDVHYWRGEILAGDERTKALFGTGLKATLPGGGLIEMPPLGEAGAVVRNCVPLLAAFDPSMPPEAGGQTQDQTLPNLASNPARSPAAR